MPVASVSDLRSVLRVLLIRCNTQIRTPVVKFVTIYVITL